MTYIIDYRNDIINGNSIRFSDFLIFYRLFYDIILINNNHMIERSLFYDDY